MTALLDSASVRSNTPLYKPHRRMMHSSLCIDSFVWNVNIQPLDPPDKIEATTNFRSRPKAWDTTEHGLAAVMVQLT